MIAMLRRRLMGGGKKKWTIEVQDTSGGGYSASVIYPLINGEKRGPGVYEVNDGDTITLYAKGNGRSGVPAVIQVNDTTVASVVQARITSYAYKVNSNCKIRMYYKANPATQVGIMNTHLTT